MTASEVIMNDLFAGQIVERVELGDRDHPAFIFYLANGESVRIISQDNMPIAMFELPESTVSCYPLFKEE